MSERAAMPREMTGYYRAEVQVGGCFVGIAAGRPSSSGSGYTDLVYFIRPGSPKRKQFRPGVNPARRVAKIEGLLEIEFGPAAWQEHRRHPGWVNFNAQLLYDVDDLAPPQPPAAAAAPSPPADVAAPPPLSEAAAPPPSAAAAAPPLRTGCAMCITSSRTCSWGSLAER